MASPFQAASKAIRNPPVQKAGDLTLTDARGWKIVFGSAEDGGPTDFLSLVLDAFRSHPVASAAVREIQTSVSEARLFAHEEGEGMEVGERLIDTEADDIIWYPNERDSYVALVERVVQHFLLGGNGYLRKERDGAGNVVALYPVRPDMVTKATTDENNIPLTYVIQDLQTGKRESVPADDIVHIPDQDPLNDVFGMPRLMAAAEEIGTDRDASTYLGEILKNHGTPGIIINVSEDVQGAEITRAEERFHEKFGPDRGRGKAAFISGGSTVHNIGFSLDDLEFTGLRAITREGICAAMGVDPKLINVGSATKGGNSLGGTEHREARRKLWAQTIMPMLRRFEATLNKDLAPEFGEGIVYRFDVSDVEALKESQNDRVERAAKMREAGSFTAAEIRTETGHSPEPADDDDTPIVADMRIQVIPQDTYAEGGPDPAGSDGDEGDGGGSGSQGDDGSGEDEERAAVGRPSRKSVRLAKGLMPVAETDEERELAWKRFDDFARSMESDFETPARQQFDLERREVMSLARNILRDSDTEERGREGPPETKVIDADSLDDFKRRLGRLYDDYHRDWRRRYEELTRQTTEVVGTQVANELGLSFSVFDEDVARFIRERPNLLAGRVTDTTFGGIQTALEAGLREGESTQQIAQRINDVFGKGLYRDGVQILSAEQRATLIARTETTAVTNGAAVSTVKNNDVGVEYWKVWLTQGDDRVREEHLFMEGERVDVEKDFSNGLEYPSEPNCRCTTLFEQKGSNISEGF